MYLESYELPVVEGPLNEEETEQMLQDLEEMVRLTEENFDSWLESCRESLRG